MEKSNIFTKQLIKKTEAELQSILTSEHHVYEAKQAAMWELERRSLNPETELSDPKPPLRSYKYRMSKAERKEFKYRMVLFGIALIGIAFYFNYDILFVTESSLIPINGRVQYAKTYIERVSARGRFGTKTYSNKATLEIKLIESPQKFKLFENIEQSSYHQRYNELTRLLTRRTPVTIWVSENQKRYGPDFFKLDVRGKTVVDMDYSTSIARFGFISLSLFGVLFIYLGTRTDWIEKIRGFTRS